MNKMRIFIFSIMVIGCFSWPTDWTVEQSEITSTKALDELKNSSEKTETFDLESKNPIQTTDKPDLIKFGEENIDEEKNDEGKSNNSEQIVKKEDEETVENPSETPKSQENIYAEDKKLAKVGKKLDKGDDRKKIEKLYQESKAEYEKKLDKGNKGVPEKKVLGEKKEEESSEEDESSASDKADEDDKLNADELKSAVGNITPPIPDGASSSVIRRTWQAGLKKLQDISSNWTGFGRLSGLLWN